LITSKKNMATAPPSATNVWLKRSVAINT